MKNNKISQIVFPFIGVVFFTLLSSCEKWLDIRPQVEVESDVVFEKESGFQDALTGIYVKMGNPNLYGKELTFGLVDGLAGQFNGLAQSTEYFSTIQYNYSEQTFISKSDNIFTNAYNAIANLNNLIVNLNRKGNEGFTGVHYHIIRGEAYGLRALLHFDLLRLYGPSSVTAGVNELTIPYMDSIGTVPKSPITVDAILTRVLMDLATASSELKPNDPILVANAANSTVYLRDRFYKLNYYAVKALEARVYLYKGDKAKAAESALAVINSNVFQWTPSSQIAVTDESSRNKLFTQEHIFALNQPTLNTIVTNPSFFDAESTNLLAKSRAQHDNLFAGFDYRKIYLFKANADSSRMFSSKLIAPTASGARIPMIRKSEMYYIAAEALADANIPDAAQYLDEVRKQRNLLSPLPTDLTADALQAEIELEYRKEFIGEGQLFFYYKRRNATRIPDVQVLMNNGIYVLPLPDRQIVYGN